MKHIVELNRFVALMFLLECKFVDLMGAGEGSSTAKQSKPVSTQVFLQFVFSKMYILFLIV